jgi:magnesium-transporting ATPase (P-type)
MVSGVLLISPINPSTVSPSLHALEELPINTVCAFIFCHSGSHKTLNPKEIVVGDVLCLKGGDQAYADSVLFDNDERNGVSMDEAALTGESELVKKHVDGKDPFLLSSTVR